MKIETYTGGWFDYDDPRSEDIHIEDIAHALSHTCRFAGHCSRFYSVAEHAIYVRSLVIQADHSQLGYAALHHDDHEAYLGDVPSPLKTHLQPLYSQLTEKVDHVIGRAFGIPPHLFDDPVVKAADAEALLHEATYLKMSSTVWTKTGRKHGIIPISGWRPRMSPDEAEQEFLAAHYEEVSLAHLLEGNA